MTEYTLHQAPNTDGHESYDVHHKGKKIGAVHSYDATDTKFKPNKKLISISDKVKYKYEFENGHGPEGLDKFATHGFRTRSAALNMLKAKHYTYNKGKTNDR